MVAAGVAPTVGAAFAVMAVIGFASMVFMATGNSMMQVASAPSMRGRVMSVYAMVFLGSTPIGGPIAGWVGQHLGPRTGLLGGGILAILAGLAVLPRIRSLRPSAQAGRSPLPGTEADPLSA